MVPGLLCFCTTIPHHPNPPAYSVLSLPSVVKNSIPISQSQPIPRANPAHKKSPERLTPPGLGLSPKIATVT